MRIKKHIKIITLAFVACLAVSVTALLVFCVKSFNGRIFYYQTNPLRLVKADAELGDYSINNNTVDDKVRYIKFANKTYTTGALVKHNLETEGDEMVERALKDIAARNEEAMFSYKLVQKGRDRAIVDLYIKSSNDAANKTYLGGKYYSGFTTYILRKEKGLWYIADKGSGMLAGKPVIYLYPASEEIVRVKLDFKGELTCTYPQYNGEWKITAYPDGKLINLEDKREYSYLYWEGLYINNWDITKGFVLKGAETEKFLQEKLEYLGLTPKEYNEFIVYWLPILQKNKYNLITFAGEDYEKIAPLLITPKPDSILRVMMVYKPLSEPIKVPEQELKPFVRKGFTVIEWGGTEVK